MKTLGIGHRLAAVALAVLLAAPCVVLAERQMEQHEFERAHALSHASSLRAQPVELRGIRERVAPYRRLRVRGEFDFAREILVAGHALHGEPGFHLVTPLRVEDGAFLVLRGWIPLDHGNAAGLEDLQRPGEISVEGFALPPEGQTAEEVSASADTPSGAWPLRVEVLQVDPLRSRIEYPLFRYVVQQIGTGDTRAGALPAPLPAPRVGDGSHRRNANLLYAASALLAGLPFAGLWWLRRRG